MAKRKKQGSASQPTVGSVSSGEQGRKRAAIVYLFLAQEALTGFRRFATEINSKSSMDNCNELTVETTAILSNARLDALRLMLVSNGL